MAENEFVISDNHLGHRGILGLEPESRAFCSIEEHDLAQVRAHNSVIHSNKCVVWFLGDVVWNAYGFRSLSKMRGRKYLVLGNHDTYPADRYLKYFSKVFGVASVGEFILSHVPVHPCQFTRYKGNIHGHLHSKVVGDNHYENVCVERVGFTPVPLDTVIDNIRKRMGSGGL